jgi:hypothetical protein
MKRALTIDETSRAMDRIAGEPQRWGTYGRIRQRTRLQPYRATIQTPHGAVEIRGVADWREGPPETSRARAVASGKRAAIAWALMGPSDWQCDRSRESMERVAGVRGGARRLLVRRVLWCGTNF